MELSDGSPEFKWVNNAIDEIRVQRLRRHSRPRALPDALTLLNNGL